MAFLAQTTFKNFEEAFAQQGLDPFLSPDEINALKQELKTAVKGKLKIKEDEALTVTQSEYQTLCDNFIERAFKGSIFDLFEAFHNFKKQMRTEKKVTPILPDPRLDSDIRREWENIFHQKISTHYHTLRENADVTTNNILWVFVDQIRRKCLACWDNQIKLTDDLDNESSLDQLSFLLSMQQLLKNLNTYHEVIEVEKIPDLSQIKNQIHAYCEMFDLVPTDKRGIFSAPATPSFFPKKSAAPTKMRATSAPAFDKAFWMITIPNEINKSFPPKTASAPRPGF